LRDFIRAESKFSQHLLGLLAEFRRAGRHFAPIKLGSFCQIA
jgi:hypothetical protein